MTGMHQHWIRAALACFCLALGVEAAEYFVAVDGDDNHPGTLQEPWRDPVRAAERLGPGDTLYFRAGRYRCRTGRVVGLAPSRDGEEGRPITFKNYQNEHVIIDVAETAWGLTNNGFDWIVFDGFEVTGRGRNNMKIANHHGQAKQGAGRHVTIRNCEIHGARSANVFAIRTPFLTIENCHIHSSERSHGIYLQVGCHNAVVRHVTSENNAGNSGMQLNAAGGGITNALVEANWLQGNAHGFSLMGVVDSVFRGNVLLNNGVQGPRGSGNREIILWTYDEDGEPGVRCENNLFEHNTLVHTMPPGHTVRCLVESKAGTRGTVFRNNVFVVRQRPVFALESFEGFVFEHNLLYTMNGAAHVLGAGDLAAFAQANALRETGTLEADPGFRDMAAGDVRLAANSPGIGAGIAAHDADLPDGKAPDIGARPHGESTQIGSRLPWRAR